MLGTIAKAQYYSTGADPLGLHWLRSFGSAGGNVWQINVDSSAWQWGALASGVIDAQAQKIESDFPALSLRGRRIDVLVHSHDAYSNGLVTWAPRRLEAYAYDLGNDDCVPWVEHLLTHEYRHVLQTQSTITGFSRFLYGLFGEQSTGLVLGLFVPRWYLEGDAVWAETNYTAGGRGRNSDFLQQMRALATSGRTPSFGQAYFGSYATRAPDFYHMGYLMVSEVSDSLGNAVFGSALHQVGRLPFTFFPFQRSLRKQTGMRPMRLYSWALDNWTEKWKSAQAKRTPTAVEPLLPAARGYREAVCTQQWDGGIVCYSTSPDFIGRFDVYDKSGKLIRTIIPSQRNESRFVVDGNCIIWSERRQHGRWANASTNCLMEADLTTGKTWRISDNGNLHSPAVGPSGYYQTGGLELAYVSVGDDMSHSIIHSTWDGNEGRGFVDTLLTLPVGWQIPELIWRKKRGASTLDDGNIIFIVVSPRGREIVNLNVNSGEMTSLFGPCYRGLKDVSVAKVGGEKRLFFAMDSDDEGFFSDIYSIGLTSGLSRREVVARDGAAWPVYLEDVGKLAVSLYGPDGYTPSVASLRDYSAGADSSAETGLVCSPHPFVLPTDTLSRDGFTKVGPMGVHLRPNIHSWGPIIVDSDNQSVAPGLSIASQNLHGTVYFQAGYNFSPDNDAERIFADVTWDWLWPRLKFGGRWGHSDYNYSFSYTLINNTENGTRTYDIAMRTTDRSHLSHLTFEASLPLTHNSGAWLRAITPSASFDWQRSTGLTYDVVQTETTTEPNRIVRYQKTTADSRYFGATFGINSHILRRVATNDIGYRYGVSFSAIYDRATRFNDFGGLLNLNLRLYLPGIGRHHQISLYASAQTKQPGTTVTSTSGYSYHRMVSDRVAAPYGLSRVSNKSAALFRATYALPLANPDWQWGPVAYIKRINLRAIYDYGLARVWDGMSTIGTSRRWTASGELWAETRFATLTYPVNIGCRATYLHETSNVAATLLFSVAFR